MVMSMVILTVTAPVAMQICVLLAPLRGESSVQPVRSKTRLYLAVSHRTAHAVVHRCLKTWTLTRRSRTQARKAIRIGRRKEREELERILVVTTIMLMASGKGLFSFQLSPGSLCWPHDLKLWLSIGGFPLQMLQLDHHP